MGGLRRAGPAFLWRDRPIPLCTNKPRSSLDNANLAQTRFLGRAKEKHKEPPETIPRCVQ